MVSFAKNEILFYRLTFYSLCVLAVGTFSSVTISALSHILLLLPGIYFTKKFLSEESIKRIKASTICLDLLFFVVIISVFANWSEMHWTPVKHILKGKYFLFGLFSVFAYYYTFEYFIDEKKKRMLLNLFLICTSIATVSGMIGVFSGFNPIKFKDACHPTRACGLYGMYMTYGYGMGLYSILLVGLYIYRDKVNDYISSKWILVHLIIALTGLFYSYARGAWIGFLVALPFFFFKRKKRLFMSLSSLIILSSLTAFYVSPKIQEMFTSSSRIQSISTRISMYQTAWKAFSEKPFLGYGYRNFEPNVSDIKRKYKIDRPKFKGHAHNNFFEHLASTGFLGFLMTFLFHLFWLFESYNRDDVIGNITFPFVVAFTISGQFQYTFGDGENLFLIMAIYAISSFPKKESVGVLVEEPLPES